MEPNKYYTIEILLQAFAEAGYPKSKTWIHRQEARGNLKLPRSTTNFKRIQGKKLGAVRMVTGKQIEEIIKSFLPGGKGYWSYK